jgi:MOSC domain-containing protein
MTTVGADYSVAGLWRYPVKSMQGEELDAAEITASGLLGDRRFAVIDSASGKLANAKNPRKWPRFYSYRAAYTEPPRAGSALPAVRITTPGGASATTDEAYLPKLLSEALGREVILSGPLPAATAEECVIADDLPSWTFFDSAFLHLVTTASLDRMRSLHPEGRIEPRRFRPNIVVATGPDTSGFAENDWVGRKIAIGEHVRLRVTMGTDRCNMPTLAQEDLPKDSRILRTAVRYNNAQVGVYADVISGGPIRLGDPITVM